MVVGGGVIAATLQLNNLLLVWLLLLPFFAGACAELFPRLSLRVRSDAEKAALAWAPFSLAALASLMGIVLSACLVPAALAGSQAGADYWWTRDLYHLRFQADSLSTGAALAIHAVSFLIYLHLVALRWSRASHHRAALALAAQGGGAGAALSADLMALVFCLELMLVCLWLLARLDARGPADRLLVAAHLGGLAVLGGALLMWRQAGDTAVAALPLLLLSAEPPMLRAIAGLVFLGLLPRLLGVPAHGWLPALVAARPAGEQSGPACPDAVAGLRPAAAARTVTALVPTSLLLVAAVAVALRLLPGSLMLSSAPGFAGLSLVLGLLSLWWGALRAWLSRDLSSLAAWLAVAQSGLLLLALSTATDPRGSDPALRAAALHLLVTPLALLAVWCGASAVSAQVGSDALAGLSGLIRRVPLAGACLLAGGLSLAGLPPLAGFQVQRLLIGGIVAAGHPLLAAAALLADAMLVIGVAGAFRTAFVRREAPPATAPSTPWLSLQLGLLVVVLVLFGLWPAPLFHWSGRVLAGALSVRP